MKLYQNSHLNSHGYLMLLENKLHWIKIVNIILFSIFKSISFFTQTLHKLNVMFEFLLRNGNFS